MSYIDEVPCLTCLYYSDPFIDNGWLRCLHPDGLYSEYLQKRQSCNGYKKGDEKYRDPSSRSYRRMVRRQKKNDPDYQLAFSKLDREFPDM